MSKKSVSLWNERTIAFMFLLSIIITVMVSKYLLHLSSVYGIEYLVEIYKQ